MTKIMYNSTNGKSCKPFPKQQSGLCFYTLLVSAQSADPIALASNRLLKGLQAAMGSALCALGVKNACKQEVLQVWTDATKNRVLQASADGRWYSWQVQRVLQARCERQLP